MHAFLPYDWTTGALDHFEEGFPTSLSAWDENSLDLPAKGSHYGFLFEGEGSLDCPHGKFPLRPHMSFCCPHQATISGGRGIIITSLHHKALFSLCGPLEETGRLRYIDGCTDTLLIPPTRMGDPCLNLLHIPPGTEQTSHTHPSLRLGIIVSGSGRCITPDKTFPLSPGQIFAIPAEAEHSFFTGPEEPLRVIAYHPDSDFGPTDEDHPMINRTIVTP